MNIADMISAGAAIPSCCSSPPRAWRFAWFRAGSFEEDDDRGVRHCHSRYRRSGHSARTVPLPFPHSVIVWILAFVAVVYGNELIGDQLEPYFMIGSGVVVLLLALGCSSRRATQTATTFSLYPAIVTA